MILAWWPNLQGTTNKSHPRILRAQQLWYFSHKQTEQYRNRKWCVDSLDDVAKVCTCRCAHRC